MEPLLHLDSDFAGLGTSRCRLTPTLWKMPWGITVNFALPLQAIERRDGAAVGP